MGEASLYSTFGPICPHCGHAHQADEPFYFDESSTQFTCEYCDRDFSCRVYTSTSWMSDPLPTPAQP